MITRFDDYKPSGRTVQGRRVAFGVDIDGCVDPGMLKHEDGFATASVQHFGLQMVTEVAKRAWMFVNCYSVDRGITRFQALYKWADLLREMPAVIESGVSIPDFKYLRKWGEITASFSPESLFDFLAAGDFSQVLQEGDSRQTAFQELHSVYQWSAEVNARVPAAVENVTAFSNAAKALRRAFHMGVDLCAVSGTPEEHVLKQLGKYGLLDCFHAIFAQQAGKKNAALATMMAGPFGESEPRPLLDDRVANYEVLLMMGDAPKDYAESQKANEALTGSKDAPCRMFFIKVGSENQSWKLFDEQVLDLTVGGTWQAAQEGALIDEGLANLDRQWTPEVATIETFPQKSS